MSEQPPEDPARPRQTPTSPTAVPGTAPTGAPYWAPDHPDSAMVLLLGILGMAVCQVVAPFAWVKGARVKREIDESGGKYGGRSQVQIGYVLGIVGSVILGLYVVGSSSTSWIVIVALSTSA